MLQKFRDRILNDLLPEFCNDPSRAWTTDGFKADWDKISEIDAADFLRGIDGGLVKHEGRGQYKAPRSRALEQFFWSGLVKKIPRPVTIWVEPIITVATVARLRFDLEWPAELIGMQSSDWAFDAATYLSNASEAEYIACEIKKSRAELLQVIELMKQFGSRPPIDRREVKAKELNAYKKLQALRSRRAPFFFLAVGPGGPAFCDAFKVQYDEQDDLVSFEEINYQELAYSKSRLFRV